jgi:hypothetical protein
MLAFAAEMAHDGEDRMVAGAELSWQVASLVNPVPTPETTVFIGPDVGVSVKVPVGPEITWKVVLAECPWLPTARSV